MPYASSCIATKFAVAYTAIDSGTHSEIIQKAIGDLNLGCYLDRPLDDLFYMILAK